MAAVFTTFTFDPGFFELEVLPIILDVPTSQVPAIRLVQLEGALRSLPNRCAVYYDPNALQPSDLGPAQLDVARFPVRHTTGVFHPKHVLLLTEQTDEDVTHGASRSLLVLTTSANLTRSGWWENVEVVHTEVLEEAQPTRLRDPLREMLRKLRMRTRELGDHAAIDAVLDFLRGVPPRRQRTANGRLHTDLWIGSQSVAEFMRDAVGDDLDGSCLEVISPFFDKHDAGPLRDLIDAFAPSEVRVLLPRNSAGELLCPQGCFEALADLGVDFGRLPRKLVQLGPANDAGERRVHAKAYRLFRRAQTRAKRREVSLVGSPNLTTSAQAGGKNWESAILFESMDPVTDFWLEPERLEANPKFADTIEAENDVGTTGTDLVLRYRWDTETASALWTGSQPPERLEIIANGVALFGVDGLSPGRWIDLDPVSSKRLAEHLRVSSLLEVRSASGAQSVLLVLEEHMTHRPSLLLDLSPADILRYWALLSADQRAAFIEEHGGGLPEWGGLGASLTTIARPPLAAGESMFDRFAGIFHAFAALERHVDSALDEGRETEAVSRVYGRKYDSLGYLLDRVLLEPDRDVVDSYLIGLCSRQLMQTLRDHQPEFCDAHKRDTKYLQGLISRLVDSAQPALSSLGADDEFLKWFERWFVLKARPLA